MVSFARGPQNFDTRGPRALTFSWRSVTAYGFLICLSALAVKHHTSGRTDVRHSLVPFIDRFDRGYENDGEPLARETSNGSRSPFESPNVLLVRTRRYQA